MKIFAWVFKLYNSVICELSNYIFAYNCANSIFNINMYKPFIKIVDILIPVNLFPSVLFHGF